MDAGRRLLRDRFRRERGSFFGDGDFFGNSFDPATGTYLFDYRLVEGMTQLSFDLFGRSTLLYGHYVRNLDADVQDTGYGYGARIGDAKSSGSWALHYGYRKVEADAVLGLLTHSNFGGGGTDTKGSILEATYSFHDNWNLQLTYMHNQTHIRSGVPMDFDRLQFDLNFRYR